MNTTIGTVVVILQGTGRLCTSTSFALVENETALNEALQAPSKGTLDHGGYGSVAEDGDDVDEASDDGEGDGMPDLDDGGDNRDEADSRGVVTNLTPPNCSGGGDGGSGGGAEACAGAGGAGLLSTSTVPVISDDAVPTCLECGSPARTCRTATYGSTTACNLTYINARQRFQSVISTCSIRDKFVNRPFSLSVMLR